MFPIIVYDDEKVTFPDDDIYYIICKEGVFLKKRLGVMESIAPVKNISILKSVQAMARMHIKKIPATLAQQVINFFKAVYKEHYSEAIVLLFYNQETKQHKIVCPFQEVSSAAADYNKGITIEGWDMIGTIHSHASMSAFHSGVDDKDEESFDGLHITFGNMRDDDISVSASIVANGYRVIVDPREYINQMEMTVDINEEVKVPYAQTWKWDKDQKKMVEVQTNKFYTRRNFDQRFRVRLSKDPKFNPQWMERVTKKTYAYGNWANGWYGYGAHNQGHYESGYWKNWTGHRTVGNNKNLPVPVGASGVVLPSKGVPPVKGKEVTPCDDCAFKHHKLPILLDKLDDASKKEVLAWALDQMESEADFTIRESIKGDNDLDLSHYHCQQCDGRFTVNEDETDLSPCCPTCGVDDFLIEISAAEMMMTDVEFAENQSVDDEVSKAMISCDNCACTFSKDFLNEEGSCPVCGKKLLTEVSDEDVNCPSCQRLIYSETLDFYNECPYCHHKFDLADVMMARGDQPMIDQSKKDSGEYLDPDRQAIEAAAEADKEAERIPVPGSDATPLTKPKKPGIFASLFRGKK